MPYDCGYVFCAHPESHRAAMAMTAAYLVGQSYGGLRSPTDYVPESSRRARGFATWAAVRQLGREGVAELVEVVLNQVLVRHTDDARTDATIDAVQRDGTCWLGGTTWQASRQLRISVSNFSTTDADVDASVTAIRAAAARAGRSS